ncbi:hypothetical protein [Amycolatopsis suaedae]|uniref:hypothetical protein n=1 Tax=Amycolatopsis suaedae TaxID=2510978 RepID=UPI0013EF1F46|nr:hypothetical protein [Amycolatopsis suaedae]
MTKKQPTGPRRERVVLNEGAPEKGAIGTEDWATAEYKAAQQRAEERLREQAELVTLREAPGLVLPLLADQAVRPWNLLGGPVLAVMGARIAEADDPGELPGGYRASEPRGRCALLAAASVVVLAAVVLLVLGGAR